MNWWMFKKDKFFFNLKKKKEAKHLEFFEHRRFFCQLLFFTRIQNDYSSKKYIEKIYYSYFISWTTNWENLETLFPTGTFGRKI